MSYCTGGYIGLLIDYDSTGQHLARQVIDNVHHARVNRVLLVVSDRNDAS